MPKMPKPTARQQPAPMVKPAPKPAGGGKIGAKGTVNFNPKPIDINDVCISTNCGQEREKPKVMPNQKPKHDPRFIAPKPIDHEQV